MFVSSLLAGALLLLALPGLQSYFARVLFVTLVGVFAAVTISLSSPIWFHHSWCFALLNSVYNVGSGLVTGLVLAAVIRPKV
jgi:hypothetical protein